MSSFIRFAKAASAKTSAAVAGTAAVTASQSPAHAYSIPAPGPRPEQRDVQVRKLQDAWELADWEHDRVIFRPVEVEAAAALLCRAGPSTVITEVDSDQLTSDGYEADSVIEADDLARSQHMQDMPAVVQVACRLLRKPGVQAAVMNSMLDDPEILAILDREAGRGNLDNYLGFAGFAAHGLLPAPEEGEGDAQGGSSQEQQQTLQRRSAAQGSPRRDPLWQLSLGLAEGLERAGNSMARLGAWMRGRLLPASCQAAAQDASQTDGETKQGAKKNADTWIGSVVVVMVAIIAVAVLRRPSALGRMFRAFARR